MIDSTAQEWVSRILRALPIVVYICIVFFVVFRTALHGDLDCYGCEKLYGHDLVDFPSAGTDTICLELAKLGPCDEPCWAGALLWTFFPCDHAFFSVFYIAWCLMFLCGPVYLYVRYSKNPPSYPIDAPPTEGMEENRFCVKCGLSWHFTDHTSLSSLPFTTLEIEDDAYSPWTKDDVATQTKLLNDKAYASEVEEDPEAAPIPTEKKGGKGWGMHLKFTPCPFHNNEENIRFFSLALFLFTVSVLWYPFNPHSPPLWGTFFNWANILICGFFPLLYYLREIEKGVEYATPANLPIKRNTSSNNLHFQFSSLACLGLPEGDSLVCSQNEPTQLVGSFGFSTKVHLFILAMISSAFFPYILLPVNMISFWCAYASPFQSFPLNKLATLSSSSLNTIYFYPTDVTVWRHKGSEFSKYYANKQPQQLPSPTNTSDPSPPNALSPPPTDSDSSSPSILWGAENDECVVFAQMRDDADNKFDFGWGNSYEEVRNVLGEWGWRIEERKEEVPADTSNCFCNKYVLSVVTADLSLSSFGLTITFSSHLSPLLAVLSTYAMLFGFRILYLSLEDWMPSHVPSPPRGQMFKQNISISAEKTGEEETENNTESFNY